MRRMIFMVLVCGCGSVSETNHLDGAVADSKAIDGQLDGAVPPACNLSAPFGTPTPVPGVNSNATDDWGWISDDGLTMYFDSVATGQSDFNLYKASRATTNDPFASVMLLGVGNSTDGENRAVVRGDGLELYYQRSVPQGPTHIYRLNRISATDPFPNSPVLVPNINGQAIDANPWISADGLTLYMTSTRDGTYDIFRATRSLITADFGMPVPVGELNTSAVESAPVLSADGLEVFFASNRPNANRNNIWHATRSSPNDGFGTPTMISELSSDPTEEYPNWLSADRCTLVFTSDRSGGNGGFDIWIAKRPQ